MTDTPGTMFDIFDLETLEHNLFRGRSPQDGWQRVFGGQVIGQALVAATRTVEGGERAAHSLHGYFLLPGDPTTPIVYEVDRIRDGKSFTTRQVTALQHGQAIFSMGVSFHRDEPGFSHQIDAPDVPGPEELPSEAEVLQDVLPNLPDNIKRYWLRERPVEMRPVDVRKYISPEPREAQRSVWIRSTLDLPDDIGLHKCVLAYASDFFLLDTSLAPHGRNLFDPRMMMASLDHSLWFHRAFRADEWMLYVMDSPSASGARGFCRGSIFRRDGTLIASVAQEGLIRERRT
ncbi:MAG: acyl-CoA thioesterase II [Dichotomicrobium sp.]